MALARRCLAVTLSALSASWTGVAHAAATGWIGDAHAAVRLIAAADTIGANSTLDAGLEFRFAGGWHGYWRTPGDAGVAPSMDWSGSENISREDVAWPAPSRLVSEDLQTSVYEHDVILPVKFHLSQAATPARIHLSVSYGACSDICVPYQAELSLTLPAGAGGASAEAALINSAREKVPGTPAAAGIDVIAARVTGSGSDPRLVVDLRSQGRSFIRPDLFVEGTGEGIPAAPEVALGDGGRTAHLAVRLPALPPAGRPLTLTLTDQDRSAEFVVDRR
jgi:suppressor for copper-sensitivity B